MCSRLVDLGHGYLEVSFLWTTNSYWAWMFPDRMPVLFSGPHHLLVYAEEQVPRRFFRRDSGFCSHMLSCLAYVQAWLGLLFMQPSLQGFRGHVGAQLERAPWSISHVCLWWGRRVRKGCVDLALVISTDPPWVKPDQERILPELHRFSLT